MSSKALVPERLNLSSSLTNVVKSLITVSIGVVAMALLSQVAIPLPGTPVPLTGQTFGVVLIALLMGSTLGSLTLVSYFTLGLFGAPIMAMGKSLTVIGPTSGYLVGMVLAAYIVGAISDRGFGRTFWSAFTVSFFAGAFIIFTGALGLRFFMPDSTVLAAGVIPFIVGDVIKSLAVAVIIDRLYNAKKIA
ncbi:MAG: biotin transporter BioY [Bdellovibrionota bacterium]